MAIPLHVLMVEDRESDAVLLLRELQRGGYAVSHERVETEDAMRAALERERWDLVLSDFSMPHFSAAGALALVAAMRLDIPFIFVSGALGEETAVNIMRSGVHDFVLKDNIQRLVPAIARELDAARIRRERRAADAKLDFERKLLQQLMDSSPDAISFKDVNRCYIRLNEAERRTLDAGDQEPCGKTGDDFIDPERARRRREDEERVLATAEPVFDSVERVVGEDGAVRWLSATRAPLRGSDGRIAGIVAIARDITESKRQEQMKNEFIATVNHELRTPLTSIAGALRLLSAGREATSGDTGKRLLGIALENGDRLARIVNDILDFEKINSGSMVYGQELVPIHAFIEQTIEANQMLARDYGVRLLLDGSIGQGDIATDPARLGQVITNLLSNAIRFSPRGADVVIAIESTPATVRISVKDQGPGIPPEYRDRIFEKFVQVDATDARKKGGTGLGLAIAKQITTQLGGEICLDTVPNQGSCFHVTLRRHQAAAELPSSR
ncbi:MAG: ATP-binding protein [Hyphomicrobium sp.]